MSTAMFYLGRYTTCMALNVMLCSKRGINPPTCLKWITCFNCGCKFLGGLRYLNMHHSSSISSWSSAFTLVLKNAMAVSISGLVCLQGKRKLPHSGEILKNLMDQGTLHLCLFFTVDLPLGWQTYHSCLVATIPSLIFICTVPSMEYPSIMPKYWWTFPKIQVRGASLLYLLQR